MASNSRKSKPLQQSKKKSFDLDWNVAHWKGILAAVKAGEHVFSYKDALDLFKKTPKVIREALRREGIDPIKDDNLRSNSDSGKGA